MQLSRWMMSRARDIGAQQHWYRAEMATVPTLDKAQRIAQLYGVQQVLHCHEFGRACQTQCDLVQPGR